MAGSRRGRPPIELEARPGQPLGLSPADFLARYWQKFPLLVRGARAGRPDPLTPEDLAGLACEPLALSRLVQRQGRRFALRTGPFDDADFAALPARDWTLLVQDVDKWDADVRALLDDVAFLPSWRIEDVMVSYAVPGGSVGAHVDQYDVFLAQALGAREWQIDTRPNAPTTFRPDSELRLLESFEPDHRFRVEPGDLLYLPPGVPHHGIALEPCLTFSLGMRAPSLSELRLDRVERHAEALGEAARYADPDLAPAAEPGEIDAGALRRVAVALGPLAEIGPETLAIWFGRYISAWRAAMDPAAPTRPPDEDTIGRRLARGSQLQLHPFVRALWCREGRSARLFVHGADGPVSLRMARLLGARAAIDAAAFAKLPRRDRERLVREATRGTLVLSRAPGASA